MFYNLCRYEEIKESEKLNWTFKVVKDDEGWAAIDVFGTPYTPKMLNSLMIEYLLQNASKKIGKEIKNVVGTVPAYWNSKRRLLTKESSI